MDNNETTVKDEETNAVKIKEKAKVFKKNNKEVEDLKKKISDLENEVLLAKADLINYRKRKDDEVRLLLKYCNSDIILEILSIVDDFERAITLDNEVLDDEVSKFLSGFKMIYGRLMKILENFEVKEIDALGKEFDPSLHQAVLTTKVDDKPSGIVLEVLQKGYTYKDKVIRCSMVRVSE